MAEKVFITGASSGIGWATAEEFARQKSELFLVARREDRLRELSLRCRQLGALRAEAGVFDLSLPGAGRDAVRSAIEVLGGLDVLVCNAGYGAWGPVLETSPEAMHRMWQVNYQSAYESIYEILPTFLDRRSGHIVLVSSVIGRKGMPYSAPYCATKFAQVGLGESLWGELRDQGIGVTVICPGYTATEFHQVSSPGRQQRRPLSGQEPARVARALVRAVRKRRREVHLTALGRFLLVLNRISPAAASWLTYAAARLERGK
jgi:short-subunit dehydrogenase